MYTNVSPTPTKAAGMIDMDSHDHCLVLQICQPWYMLSLLCFGYELRMDGTAGEQSVEDAVVGNLMPLDCASELVQLVRMPNHLLSKTR